MGAETKFIKPIAGVLIRDPMTKAIIPVTGTSVPWIGPLGRFYRRRVNDGTAVIVEKEVGEFSMPKLQRKNKMEEDE